MYNYIGCAERRNVTKFLEDIQMKKILAIVLALTVVLVCFAACGNKTKTDANTNTDVNTEETTATAVTYADAVEVLTKVFTAYDSEYKNYFAGGDENNATEGAPGKYDAALAEELNVAAYLPASQNANIEDAATLRHMNVNTFTGAAYKLKAGTDVKAFADEFKLALDNAQWMCGFPEKFVVISSGDYVVTMFGAADVVDGLKTTATTALTAAEVVLEGDIVA